MKKYIQYMLLAPLLFGKATLLFCASGGPGEHKNRSVVATDRLSLLAKNCGGLNLKQQPLSVGVQSGPDTEVCSSGPRQQGLLNPFNRPGDGLEASDEMEHLVSLAEAARILREREESKKKAAQAEKEAEIERRVKMALAEQERKRRWQEDLEARKRMNGINGKTSSV